MNIPAVLGRDVDRGLPGWQLPAFCLLAALAMAVAALNSGTMLHGLVDADRLNVHLLLEIFAVVVSSLVVLVTWHSRTLEQAVSVRNLLIAGFTLTAGLDLAHALSYEGMPDLLTPNSMQKAIFFWLSGRFTELIVLLLVAARVGLGGQRLHAFLWGLVLLGVLLFIGCYRLGWIPSTYVEGQGVTPFKAMLEYGLAGGFLLAALWLWRQQNAQPEDSTLRRLGLAAFIMALAEIGFANFRSSADWVHLLGHIYKVIAYGLICQAWLVSGIQEPYRRLHASKRALRARENELSAILDRLPFAIAKFDLALNYRYSNEPHAAMSGRSPGDMIGRSMSELFTPEIAARLQPYFTRAMSGEEVEFEYERECPDGARQHLLVRLVPERDADDQVDGLLAGLVDTTARDASQQALLDSLRELASLQKALDAHAIVAITDARGVITQVNDKFCEISKWSREELIGSTHKIINSGHHAADFFKALWGSIRRGEVWHGEICNRAKDGSLYWVDTTIVPFLGEQGVPVQYLAIRADITERKQAEQKAAHLASYDTLTGLMNRPSMLSRLGGLLEQRLQEQDQRFGALLLLDLDNFKEVNDTLGHPAGDELLRQVSERMRNAFRSEDLIARIGGDEFVVLFSQLGSTADSAAANAEERAERLRAVLLRPFLLQDQSISSTASLGLVVLGDEVITPDELLKRADMALYKAKADGRNCIRHFDSRLESEITERAALLRDLHVALERNELWLAYQPIVDPSGSMLGVEALIRWQHPKRGSVSPGIFIPLAEESGLITPIGDWVMMTACRQLAAWALEPARQHLSISVNVSERQFRDSHLVDRVRDALTVSGANPARLRLELTESMLHSDLDRTIEKMSTLRSIGVRFSLDDFGTGYSSLSYLKRLPLDQIKIDRSFVNDLLTDQNSASIVRAILGLASSLELDVVAEGVELRAQSDELVALGCKAFQGYLFGRPVPVEQLS